MAADLAQIAEDNERRAAGDNVSVEREQKYRRDDRESPAGARWPAGLRWSRPSAYSSQGMDTHLSGDETASNLFPLALVASLLLIFLAILLTANEIRFQGCVDTRHKQTAINADHPRQAIGVQECSRLPFGA